MGKFKQDDSADIIWSDKKASQWADGYPIGNGRIGAMIIGDPLKERVALNHDLLWRRYWKFEDRGVASIMGGVQQLCLEKRWDDAQDLLLTKIPVSSRALYINPFVPAGDLCFFQHANGTIEDYKRTLHLDTAIAEVEYSIDDIRYKREYFCSLERGLMYMKISTSSPGTISGEFTLSRLPDPDCTISANTTPSRLTLCGCFEEGVKFTISADIAQKGGRLTAGRDHYVPVSDSIPPKDLNGLAFVFREDETISPQAGISTFVDSVDEVIIRVAISTDDESSLDPAQFCAYKLDTGNSNYDEIKASHIAQHSAFYSRTKIEIVANEQDGSDSQPTGELLEQAIKTRKFNGKIFELMYNVGRYMAIASGMPQPKDRAAKAPINLQGIWNQDRKPAWDCDYHPDLNVEMYYWPLDAANLGELMIPLADWACSMIEEGRKSARSLYGCKGINLSVCDNKTVGNTDHLGICWTGAAAWISQILWIHWEYSEDINFLAKKVYPFLYEAGAFYEDFLIEVDGMLIPCPSASPEMHIKGRKQYSFISSPSTMDLELIHAVFSRLIEASELLGVDERKRTKWRELLKKVPWPVIDENGVLQEWMDKHEPGDPSHRHRSHLIGLCPGTRITKENTPEYHSAALGALKQRMDNDNGNWCSLSETWDVQILARLYLGNQALGELKKTLDNFVMHNFLTTICSWRDDVNGLNWFPGKRVFQVEAGICAVASIGELLIQDANGLIRLLPALPDEWHAGHISGIRARGGFEVELTWQDNNFQEAVIQSLRGGPCELMLFNNPHGIAITCQNRPVDFLIDGSIVKFPTKKGLLYQVTSF